ncbi:Fanconi anemia core complex-associated protein 100-like [Montipora capricornis]|uniref:Fanconi anemia core complex-associated protein 100-like n=1 Tax=Montipora capricornis TaxID=246305 RepID=UPI0035F10F73
MAGIGDVKTLHKFASVKSYTGNTIQSVNSSKRKIILLISNGSEFLYLVVDNSLNHTFRFPKPIMTVRFQDCGEKRRVFVATTDGNVFAVILPESLLKGKGSKKKCPDSISIEPKREKKDVEEDIFTELLAGGSTSEKTLHERPKQQHPLSNMTVIDLGTAVLFEPGLRTIQLVGDKIFCCVATDEGYALSVFNQIAAASCLDTLTYTTLPSLKMKVSLSSVVMSLQERQSKQLCAWKKRCHFLCVQPSNIALDLESFSVIERSFFNKLFNSEASLTDSPVLIFGGEDGQLHFWPVNSFAHGRMNSEKLGTKQASPSLLYHLQQGVSAMFVAKLCSQEQSSRTGDFAVTTDAGTSQKRNNTPHTVYCNALVFVGVRDKLVIASKITTNDQTYHIKFTEYAILGPVVCSCLNSSEDTLIHSTGKEIICTKLLIDVNDNSAKVLPALSATVLTSFNVHLPNVCAVCSVHKKRKSDEGNSQDKVYALAVNGNLLQFCLPKFQDDNSQIDPDISPQMAGEKVKSYLAELENLSAELAKVNTTIETEDRILKDLNTVIHIACEISENTRASEAQCTCPTQDNFPLSCTFKPTFANVDTSGNALVTLNCKLVNRGRLPLSSCWSLMIRVQSKEPWLNQIRGESSTQGKSVPVMSLSPGSCLEIEIPLSKSVSSSFHLVVEAHLHCDLNVLVADLRSYLESDLFVKPIENVIIPIARQMLDFLHFVTPFRAGSQVPDPRPAPGTKEEVLQALDELNVESCPLAYVQDFLGNEKASVSREVSLRGSYSAAFHLSKEAVSFIENLPQKTGSVTTQQATVLQFILRESSVTRDQIDAECSDINLLTVNSNVASIHVKPASRDTLEITLRCSSVQLLCRLHEAVLTRLRPVVMRNTRSCQLRAYDLQKATEKLQILQRKIISLEDSISTKQDMLDRGSELKVQLWNLYEELRKIVLLV